MNAEVKQQKNMHLDKLYSKVQKIDQEIKKQEEVVTQSKWLKKFIESRKLKRLKEQKQELLYKIEAVKNYHASKRRKRRRKKRG